MEGGELLVHGEQRRIHADAQGQRSGGDDREPPVLSQEPDCLFKKTSVPFS